MNAAATTAARPLGAHRGRLRALWDAALGGIGAAVGLAPHVLHHVGLLAGTALVAGATGTLAFATLGLVASVPLLLRLRRRFGSWRAPALGLVAFAAMFSLSAFVIGPALSAPSDSTVSTPPVQQLDHAGHHGGQP